MFEELHDVFRTSNSFLITSHVNPEGDSLGSVFAMDYLLRSLGKRTVVIFQDPVPQELAFLNGSWLQSKDVEGIKEKPTFDCVVIIDAPSLARIGDVVNCIADRSRIVNIDHHVSNRCYAKWNVIEPQASSCGEMIYILFKEMNVPVTPEVAMFLYTAISTDTGSFRYPNTSAKTHMIAAELIQTGLDVTKLNEQLYCRVAYERVKLHSILMDKIQFAQEGGIAWTTLTEEDLKRSGARAEDGEGIVDKIRNINGVNIAYLLRKVNDKAVVKVSFRSKGTYDVNKLAGYFNGGGHAQASGCTIEGTLEEAVEMILTKVDQLIYEDFGE